MYQIQLPPVVFKTMTDHFSWKSLVCIVQIFKQSGEEPSMTSSLSCVIHPISKRVFFEKMENINKSLFSDKLVSNATIDVFHGAAILNFSHLIKPRLEEQNGLVPFAKWLLAFLIVIRYEEQDQDGGSVKEIDTNQIKVCGKKNLRLHRIQQNIMFCIYS